LLINFFSILKNIFLKNIFFELILFKSSILFKLFLNLFSYQYLIKYNFKVPLSINLFNNYFFLERSNYLNCIVYYNLYNNSNNNLLTLLNTLLHNKLTINSILKFINSLHFNYFSSIPTRNKCITVLRSPHTDKKSREQFILKEYKKCIKNKNGLDFFNLFINIKKVFALNTCVLKNKKYIKSS
jgi:hypothetical protein